MAEVAKIEKFTVSELSTLRGELMKAKMDSWQAADRISTFLAGRGYGVNSNAMRNALPQMAVQHHSHDAMQSVLENIAYVM